MPRVTDAACLAAHDACDNRIKLSHEPPHVVIYDISKPMSEREIWRGPDSDPADAELHFKIEMWRPCITAALNVH